jgi:hypothetical protein
MYPSVRTIAAAAFAVALTTPAIASLYIDEDFEGAAAFVDRDWITKGESTVPTPAIVAVKGAFLRSYDADPLRTSPKPTITNTGTMVSSRHFLGAKSLELAPGQVVRTSPDANGKYVNWDAGEFRLIQFAVSASPATLLLPPGTKVGHLKSDWSIATTNTVETTVYLNFVVNNAGKIDVLCSAGNQKVGEFGAVGQWALLTVMPQIRTGVASFKWAAYDPLSGVYKGPTTANPPSTGYPDIPPGMYFFCNDTTASVSLLPDQVGAGWGNDFVGENAIMNTSEMGWEITAMNGGTLYIDDLYWDSTYHTNATRGWEQEAAARMKQFNQAANEQAVVTVARDWHLLE